ncbi:mechanosensitive ion channel family protein [Colwellia hornerae]|uniref:Small-conductance mechanosensitive channel n=1 Tax=Colwellia hornerae TaxID=89402 RepID=A0A5C6QTB9_9GAMM|nr:mechanosensitive ion channel domain-containing protein [Colwellia hornerae]TWX56962.1 mechanosensitive ion channel [Colwellia hornerae]TWX62313.1 mechanosensitive ion channel [Colwellia hornerae]TWX72355.1 mechanosensitive ion channel [Colwellia hornerae]
MDMILDWFAQNEAKLLQYLIDFGIAIAIIIVGKWVAKLVRKGIDKMLSLKNIDKAVISFVGSIAYGVVFFVAIIAAISHLGFNTSSLVAIVGAAGLAVGLALQGSLSNFASGVLLIVLKPFKSGDFIDVAGIAGIVEEINIFSSKLRTGDNKTVIIPNGKITSSTITNFSTKPERRLDLVIGVSYSADLAKTKALLTKLTTEHELVLKEKETVIGVQELAESSVNFVVRPWVKSDDYWILHRDLLEKIKIALDDAGIEIPFPQLSVHVNQETKNEQ